MTLFARPRRERSAVLFIAPNRELPFVEHDREILERDYEVEVLSRRDYPSRRALLPAVLRRLATRRFALLYVWFAEPHDTVETSRLAAIFGLKIILVTGGYDVAAVPSVGYGSLLTERGRRRVRRALLGADVVLPFSEFSAEEVRRVGGVQNLRVLYPGVDCQYFAPSGVKEPIVLTVARLAPEVWRRKGLDLFARCSRLLPQMRFVIVGRCEDSSVEDELRRLGGANLELVRERVSRQELRRWYQRSSVYAQLSVHEGFGLAVAEAMACECVPVASNLGSLPEVVGDCGSLIDRADIDAVAAAIRKAVTSSGTAARERIIELYSRQQREHGLTNLVGATLAGTALPRSTAPLSGTSSSLGTSRV